MNSDNRQLRSSPYFTMETVTSTANALEHLVEALDSEGVLSLDFTVDRSLRTGHRTTCTAQLSDVFVAAHTGVGPTTYLNVPVIGLGYDQPSATASLLRNILQPTNYAQRVLAELDISSSVSNVALYVGPEDGTGKFFEISDEKIDATNTAKPLPRNFRYGGNKGPEPS